MQDGQHVIDVPGISGGFHQLVFSFTQRPSAGTLTIEARYGMSGEWLPIPEGTLRNLAALQYCVAFGAIDALRFTLAGVIDGSGAECYFASSDACPGPGFPAGIFEGLRAGKFRPAVIRDRGAGTGVHPGEEHDLSVQNREPEYQWHAASCQLQHLVRRRP